MTESSGEVKRGPGRPVGSYQLGRPQRVGRRREHGFMAKVTFHLQVDVLQQLHDYADRYGMSLVKVHELALRRFFAQEDRRDEG